jgi:hypothetical protein
MELIDILMPTQADCPNFVVNNAVDNVVVNIPAAYTTMNACENHFSFVRGDNFTILSAGYFIPERFVVWGYQNADPINLNSVPQLSLLSIGSLGLGVPLHIGQNGKINIPFPNYEFSIGQFIDTEISGMTDPLFRITCKFPFDADADKLLISMIDVPAALNGKTFYCIPFIKVLHNLGLL